MSQTKQDKETDKVKNECADTNAVDHFKKKNESFEIDDTQNKYQNQNINNPNAGTKLGNDIHGITYSPAPIIFINQIPPQSYIINKPSETLQAAKANEKKIDFPGYSTIEYQSKCCCCTKTILNADGVKVIYWGEWETNFGPIILVNAIFVLINIFSWAFAFYAFPWLISVVIEIVFIFLTSMSLISYFMIIVKGPGYFPFYYHLAKENKLPLCDDPTIEGTKLSFAGYITNKDQYEWAQQNEKPNRSIISSSARRFVIRPDHFCGWTTTWIGKRNHKFFMLFLLYSLLTVIYSFLTFLIASILYLQRDYKNWRGYVCILFVIISAAFFFWINGMYLSQKFNINHGMTQWENWNAIDTSLFQKSKAENIADVYGGTGFCAHLCPTDPWKNVDLDQLIENYPNYYDENNVKKVRGRATV